VLTTNSDVLTLNPLNGDQSLSINSNAAWKAKCADNWCSLSDTTGTGNLSIVVLCKDNLSGEERETKISINSGDQSKSIIVKQTGGQVLFQESFNDNSKGWAIRNDSLIENVKNGYYSIKNNATMSAFFVGTRSIINSYTGNYLITFSYNQISGTSAFGLTFANKDVNNFYRISIYPQDIYIISKRLNNVNSTILQGTSTTIESYNTVTLFKKGNNCDIIINGIKVNNFDLSTPLGSYVGFYSYPLTEIDLDEFKVVQL
jgi:hypothetical protein